MADAKMLKKVPVREQDPKVRATNFEEVCLGYNQEEAMEEAQRCLGCKKPKCVEGCPVSINIPGFIEHIKEGNMHLGSTGNLGETSDDMEIQKAGEDLVIGFNPRYLKEGVSLFADKTVRLVFRDSASPLNVYGTSEDGLKYILLPVRLQN